MSVQQGRWRVPSWARLSFSVRSREGTTRGGLGRGAQPVAVALPSRVSAPECKASAEKMRASQAVRQAKKKKNVHYRKSEGDWLLRRISVPPFWWSPSYTPPVKNSLKGWSCSRMHRISWSRSFEKIGASEITGWQLGNLASLTDHCDLFFVYKVDLMSHLINEPPCGPYHSSLLF